MQGPSSLAQPVTTLYTLGPEGTFSDQAARKFQAAFVRQGQLAPRIVFTRTIAEVLRQIPHVAQCAGIVPIENSYAGTVVVAQDGLAEHDMVIEGELNISVRFRLLANAPLGEVERVFVQPVAYEQCGFYLAEHLPQAQPEFTHSNTDSGERLAHSSSKAAAVVPVDYGQADLSQTVASDIQNDPRNTTRFLAVRHRSQALAPDFARSKVSLLVDPNVDRPGLLHDILGVFKKYEANLCRIESRPARTRPWAYVFYLDIHHHERGAEIVEDLRAMGQRVVLMGTYDEIQ